MIEKNTGATEPSEPSVGDSSRGWWRGWSARLPLNLRARILIPTMTAIVLLVGLFAWSFYSHKRLHMQQESAEVFTNAHRMYMYELLNEQSRLSTAIEALKSQESLQRAFLQQDRPALLAASRPLFKTLRTKHRITHFYFHGPDRRNFLRVHQPPRHGDLIDRHTARRAEATGKPAGGIELGPLGTFTLRVVHPWVIDGRQIGYIELGEEIEHITYHIHQLTNLELFVYIKKTNLNQKGWKEGMAMLGRPARWGDHPEMVLIDGSLRELPRDVLAHHLRSTDQFASPMDFRQEDQHYTAMSFALRDAGEEDVGRVILTRNTGKVKHAVTTLIWEVTAVSVVLAGLSFLLLYVLLGRVDRQIQGDRNRLAEANQTLTREVADRKRVQRQIERAKREWERTFDAVPDMIAIIDTDFRVLRVNRAMAEALDKQPVEMIGRHCYKQIHRTESPPGFCPLKQTIADGQPHECQFQDPVTGKYLWVTVNPIHAGGEEDLGVVHIVRDVTSRVQVEQDLQQNVQELEQFNELAIGRELRMIELKREVNEYADRVGLPHPYDLSFADDSAPQEALSHVPQEMP